MKPKSIIIILSIIIIIVVIKLVLLKPDNENPTKKGLSKDQVANVTGFVVHAQLLENKIFSSGTVMANEVVELRPEVSGKLVSIRFKEGSYARKGELLAKINDIDLQAQLKKANLELELVSQKKDRLKGMLDIQGVSQEEYDGTANQTLTISADIDYIKAQIAKTEIYAPFSGKIGLRQVSQGSYVTNASVIATIQQTGQLKIDFTVPEKYAAIVALGDLVHFHVENQAQEFTAKVYAIEPMIDQQTRNFSIRAVFSNPSTKVYPGSFAKVELVASKQLASLMIPTEAVIPELKGKKVFISKDGKAKSVQVETGTRTDKLIEITSGLSEGDTVITTGIMTLKPDAKIKIIKINN